MVRLDENLAEIQRAQKELQQARKKGPHYRDTLRWLQKLQKERAEALRNLKQAGRI